MICLIQREEGRKEPTNVKGIKSTLADTMSRLVILDPHIVLVKEPEGYQFGKQVEHSKETSEKEIKLISLAPMAPVPKLKDPIDPIPDKDVLCWGINPEEIIE